jgi:peroxiredoxin family protein
MYGLLAKAANMVLTGTVGVATYEVLRKAAAKAPVREVVVTTTAWGLRGVRKAESGADTARLNVVDVVAEARERIGEESPPPAASDYDTHDH